MTTTNTNEPHELHLNDKQLRAKKRKRNLMSKSTGSSNPIAKDLRTPKYSLRVEKDKSKYTRMAKHKLKELVHNNEQLD